MEALVSTGVRSIQRRHLRRKGLSRGQKQHNENEALDRVLAG